MSGTVLTSFWAWIAVAAPLISACLVCQRLLHDRNRGIRFLRVTVLWLTLVIVSVQVLGALEIASAISRVTMGELAGLQLAVLVVVALFLSRRDVASEFFEERAVEAQQKLPFFLKLSGLILGASYLLFALNLCTSFPDGSDSLVYHIPLAVRWLQEGSLRIPSGATWEFSLPGNGEIIEMIALATGKQFLVPFGNLLAAIVLAVAAFPITLRFSRENKSATIALLLILFSVPIIEFQAFSAYVDIFGTAFLFAAVVLFEHRYRSGCDEAESSQTSHLSLGALAISALACGLTVGTKTTFLPYCALYFVGAIYVLVRERRVHRKPVSVLAVVLAAGILLPSLFWYARDMQATGNPFYPTQISIGPHLIFPGYSSVAADTGKLLIEHVPAQQGYGDKKFVRRRAEWWIYPWTEWLNVAGSFPIVYGEGSGFGGAFAALVVVGAGFAVYRCFSGFESNEFGPSRMWVLMWLLLLLFWIFAMRRDLRFGLPLWVFACLLSAPAIVLSMKAYPRAFAVLFVCAVASTFAISSLVPLHDFAGHLLAGRWSRAAIYNYPELIDELPPGSCVLNDTRLPEKDFALAGKNLTNRVVTAFEAPRELTPEFLSSRNIDYVVQVTTAENEDSSPAGLPKNVTGSEVFHAIRLGQTWMIWKVER